MVTADGSPGARFRNSNAADCQVESRLIANCYVASSLSPENALLGFFRADLLGTRTIRICFPDLKSAAVLFRGESW
jgi:hypothetical protein